MRSWMVILGLIAGIGAILLAYSDRRDTRPWTTAELHLIRSLWIANLPPPPPDVSNHAAISNHAAALGHRLFFDPRLSGNGKVACSTCHQLERYFTDGLPVSVGTRTATRNAMTVVGSAYSPWLFWDGRKDSLWSQALAPLESSVEQNGNRAAAAHLIAGDPDYRNRYESLFGQLPDLSDRVRFPADARPGDDPVLGRAWESMSEPDRETVSRILTNLGKALAAYQRVLIPGTSRFDEFIENLNSESPHFATSASPLTESERAGLRLFIGTAQCVNCHNGPLLTNNSFHNTGSLSAPGQLPSKGRSSAVELARLDTFNCLGPYSDADPDQCMELTFAATGQELIGAHRTPSLRNVSRTAPYMHAGQLATLEAVVDQYNRAPQAMVGHNESKPLGLSAREQADLVSFLKTLDGPIAADQFWLMAP